MTKDGDSSGPKLSEIKVQVIKVLGAGAHGSVLLVLDKREGGGRHALRKLKREEDADDLAIERARAEAESSPKLGNPSILRTHDFRVTKSFFKTTGAEQLMEYVEGKTLDKLIGKLDVRPAILIFQKVAGALAHMQRRQVSHGDLRPDQIFLTRTGQVKVRGYGRSAVDPKFKEKMKFHQAYTAPELVKSNVVTPQTEVYALGATMYHVFTGQAPIPDVRGRGDGKLTLPTVLNVKIPTALNNVIVTCLQSHAPKRYPEPYNAMQDIEKIAKSYELDDSVLAGLAADEE